MFRLRPRFAARLVTLAVLATCALPAAAQTFDSTYFNGLLRYRNVGPHRGGRVAAVTGVPNSTTTFYMGAAGGGVWKTTDGGGTWANVSDGFFGGSIGAVAVAESDPNVVYAGGGESTIRGNVSYGYGVWKSENAGRTWRAAGLPNSRHVPRIRVHPRDPDLVYAAVLGDVFKPGAERGVYRSRDGGGTWERVLFVNENAGAFDLTFDPTNPRTLYATTWRVRRTPYSLESGGEGSGIYKSTDGGSTWVPLTRAPGLPTGTLGIIGVAVSPANPDRVWAQVEAADGGLFRSDDAGATWRKVNEDRNLRQRAWYYSRLVADPRDADVVYALNVQFWKSKDGGRTFADIDVGHSDTHDLWIAPDDPQRMILGDDGGAEVTYDGGANWSTLMNQPTAQFYRVTTDNSFPYRIYGAQQDNSTVRVRHRSNGGAITENDWEPTAGGESGWIAPDPENNDVVYGGSYGGYLTRLDHETGQKRDINPWPDNPMGHGAADLKERFQWNFPIVFSRHDPNRLFAASQHLFSSTNEGQTWTRLSGDLTRNDTSKMGPSGGPITKDNTSVEYYGTVFSFAESSERGVMWTGSDDGLVHVTRDDGRTWTNVTPPTRGADGLPEFAQINSLEADPFAPGGLFVAATRYKWGDYAPYLFHTADYGRTWRRIDRGIDRGHFTRVVRADPARRGLLYAGTESGMYVSLDGGADWRPFSLNLPVVPVTDLAVKDGDLIVATQGRSFWVMDDLTPLHRYETAHARAAFHLVPPRPAHRMEGAQAPLSRRAGQNAPAGVVFRYTLASAPDSGAVRLRILDASGGEVATVTPKTERTPLPIKRGANTFAWAMRYSTAETIPGLVLWGGGTQGPRAIPGAYTARLVVGKDSLSVPFEIRPDPRAAASADDFAAQFAFLTAVRDKLSETHRAIKRIRDVREQVNGVAGRLPSGAAADSVKAEGRALNRKLTAVEEALYQTKNRSGQDPLNYPIRLNNRLSGLVGSASQGDARPTDQQEAVRAEVTALIDAELARLDALVANDLAAFNASVRGLNLDAVVVKPAPATAPR